MSQILKAIDAAGAKSFSQVRSLFEAPPFHLRVSEHGELYALRYHRHESDFRSPVVRQARGIVLEKGSNRIVSWAFDKFYEYGEDAPSYRERPNLRKSLSNPLLRYERKYDGVLIKVVLQPDGKPLVSTNGRIDAAEAPLVAGHSAPDGDICASSAAVAGRNLRQLFVESGGLELPFEPGHCYMFELLHPEVPTVVPAQAPALVHLATRRLSGDFSELPPESRFGSVLVPQIMDFRSFVACRDAARVLPWDDEGFVVVDSTGSRTKVKSEAYKAMQRLLVGDSECREEDALSVGLTLHSATTPLPAYAASLVTSWRERLDALVRACVERATLGRARALQSGRSARATHAAIETALGGRLPRHVRSVISGACSEWWATSVAEPLPVAIVNALRRSRLGPGEIRTTLQGV